MAVSRSDIQILRPSSSRSGERRMRTDEGVRTWTEGNTVRAAVPARWEQESPQPVREKERRVSNVPRMNVGYVMFLALAASLMVVVCAFYLKLQYRCTTLQKSVTSLQTSLASLKLENDEEYNRIMAGVNLEQVKEDAMNRLGMVYAFEDQIVTYEPAREDFVKQYLDIPE